MPRDIRFMYMTHCCFYVCCIDCGGLSECLLCSGVVKDSVFLALKYYFSVVTRGAVGARVWEV